MVFSAQTVNVHTKMYITYLIYRKLIHYIYYVIFYLIHWCIYIGAFYNCILPKIWNIEHIFIWNMCQYNLVTLLTWTYTYAHILMCIYIYKNFVVEWNISVSVWYYFACFQMKFHSIISLFWKLLSILYFRKGEKNRQSILKCWSY